MIFCDVSWSRKSKHIIANYCKLMNITAKLKKIAPDLLYSNGGYENIFAVKLAKRLKIRLITHVRNFFPPLGKDKYQFGKSDVIIACSNFVAKTPKEFNSNVQMVHNGISADKFNPQIKLLKKQIRQQFGFKDEVLIGSVGNVQERKGYREFVEVANEVLKKIPSGKFLIIGEDSTGSVFTENLKKRIKYLGLEEKIVFMGFVKEIDKIFAILDIFLFPTRNEPFGRSIIEAIACKVPVISCDSGAVEEIIENEKDGFLFKIGDVNGMAQCVVDLIKDKELADTITENAYRKFTDQYTIDKVISKVDSIITALFSKN